MKKIDKGIGYIATAAIAISSMCITHNDFGALIIMIVGFLIVRKS